MNHLLLIHEQHLKVSFDHQNMCTLVNRIQSQLTDQQKPHSHPRGLPVDMWHVKNRRKVFETW